MGRKVFQIGFILLVMAAFGTVFNHYLKNKVSDYNNYLSYIESYPQTRISTIDPIVITLPKTFNKNNYQLNTPLDASIIQFDPEVEGTLYWSDQKTLEFYPDRPLLSDAEYMVKVDINKIYQLPSKLKYFRFKLNTFKQILFVNQGIFLPTDSTLKVQEYHGSIVFNDFIDFDYVNELFNAEQDGKKLNISFKPGKSKESFSFIVENVKRKIINDTLLLKWDGKPLGIDLFGREDVIIPSIEEFKIKDVELKKDSILKLVIGFSDPIKENQKFDSLVIIKGAQALNYDINNKYLTIVLEDSNVEKVHLNISRNLTNVIGKSLTENISQIVNVEKDEPALRMTDSTFIISDFSDNFHWEFEALKLKAVNVQIYKIFANNVLQFLQINDFQGVSQIDRVGSIVYKKTLELSEQLQYNPEKWTKYQININGFEPEEGCVYSVLVSFNSHQTIMECTKNKPKQNVWNNFLDDYYSFKGDSVNDPCSEQYYGFRRGIHHNLYYTKLGILTKQIGNDSLYVWVTDINDAIPSKNVNIKVLNYQQQLIANDQSDNNGMVRFKLSELPSFIIAEQGKNTTYLKLKKRISKINNNEKVLFIKKRKYWSPGDTLNIGFIHNSTVNPAPNNLLTLNIYSPDKKKVYTEIKPVSDMNQYLFKYFLPKGSNIGDYKAEVTIGKMNFNETYLVLPHYTDRIKISLQLVSETNSYFEYELSVANASAFAGLLKYNVEVNSEYEKESITDYKRYSFGNKEKENSINEFSGILNETGKAIIKINKTKANSEFIAKHNFYCRIINENMGFSEYSKSFRHLLKKSIIGIKTNNTNFCRDRFYCDSTINLSFILLDKNHRKIKGKTNAKVLLYKKESDKIFNLLSSESIQFKYGLCNWATLFNFPSKGSYKVEIQTLNKSAVATHFFEIEWPDSYRTNEKNKSLSYSLEFESDTVTVSDSIDVIINAENPGNIFLTIENHNGIIFYKWYTIINGINKIKLPVNKNFYPISEIQCIFYVRNDNPAIRNKTLYVKQKVDKLHPVVYGLNEVEAEKTITVTVKEENNFPLNYILAISPDKSIDNSRNIDLYSNSSFNHYSTTTDVFGNYIESGKYSPISEVSENQRILKRRNPFAPFDIQNGPFHLSEGESKTHEITMPQYIGDVNVSVIAIGNDNQETIEVTHKISVNKSFLILTSTPENISPNEVFYLPVNVFSSRKEKREANIELSNNIELNVLDNFEKKVMVNYLDTDTTSFRLKSKRRTGLGAIDIIANDSVMVESKSINIPIKSNGFSINKWVKNELKANEKWQTRFTPIGVKGTNNAAIEYSENKNIHLSQLVLKLLNNPHPDIEHLISSSFPLLFLNDLTDVTNEIENSLKKAVQYALNDLIYYQMPSGGFSYWKNNIEEQKWCSTYAGYFMIEARKKGFEINQAVYNKWLRYQRRECLTWSFDDENSDLEQAFGLFALALADKPDINSMQKLKNKKLSSVAALQLSLAFSTIEEKKVAKNIANNKYKDYVYLNDNTFGNPLRNTAISLAAYEYLSDNLKADSAKIELEKMIVNEDYQSFQAISFSIIALAKYYANNTKQLNKEIVYTVNRGKQATHNSQKPYGIVEIPIEFTLAKTIDISNNSESGINVSIDYSGKPDKMFETPKNRFLRGTIKFVHLSGKPVNKGMVDINSQLSANVNIFSLKNNLYSNCMVLEFPIANCFNYLRFTSLTNENIHYVHTERSKVFYYFTLPEEGLQINIPLTTRHKGNFHQPPVKVYSLYNPMVKTVLVGNDFFVQ